MNSFELRGEAIRDLDSFYDEIERVLGPDGDWFGHNLDALNDVMHGGIGQLPTEFTLIWRNADRPRALLGFEAYANYLRTELSRCHSSARESVRAELREADANRGPTLFDILLSVTGDRVVVD
jgi:RNAse (barnase) inhibitor barstar